MLCYAKINTNVKTLGSRRFAMPYLVHPRFNSTRFRRGDSRKRQAFSKYVKISEGPIFLALQSVHEWVSDIQARQPGYKRDAVPRELACSQAFH